MKRIIFTCLVLSCLVLFVGCNFNYFDSDDSDVESIETKTEEDTFVTGTRNVSMDNALVSTLFSLNSRSPEEGDTGIPYDIEDVMVQAIEEMTEEELQMLQEAQNVELEVIEEVDGIEMDRGGDEELEFLLLQKQLQSTLESAFFGKTVSDRIISVNGEAVYIETPVFAGYIASQLTEEFQWDELVSLADELDILLDLEKIKNLKDQIDNFNSEEETRGLTSSHFSNPMVSNLGNKMSHGDILIVRPKYHFLSLIVGFYGHGGLFDKEYWMKKGKTDSVHSVLTAQPDQSASYFDTSVKANNPNHVTREPLLYYTKSRIVKVLRPKSYSSSKASKAVNYAKSYIDISNPGKYDLPLREAVYIGNSSHNMNIGNKAYCTKVPYSAWKKAGVNIDGDTWNLNRGFLIAPDDLYNSSCNRYISVRIKIGWFKKTFRKKTYSARTSVVKSYFRWF